MADNLRLSLPIDTATHAVDNMTIIQRAERYTITLDYTRHSVIPKSERQPQ